MAKSQKPREIGPYRLVDQIGSGGQGTVWRAFKGEAGEALAVKVLTLSHPKKRDRFLREIQTHAALTATKADNVIPLLDYDVTETSNGIAGYLVMPRAEVSLQDVKETVKERLELSLEVFCGILNGIKAAHAAGIVHRDIKPGNILFMDRSLRQPLVSDFGIALLRDTPDSDRITEIGETVGAKYFMAPEQEHGGITEVMFSADVYAAAKVLHFMLTGRYLVRERLETAFTADELRREPRLQLVTTEILSTCVIEEPVARVQDAAQLFQIASRLLESFRSPNGGAANGTNGGGLRQSYETYAQRFVTAPGEATLLFDELQDEFSVAWGALHAEIADDSAKSADAAERLIRSQQRALAATLALARTDAIAIFPDFKRLLEFATAQSEGLGGYDAITAVPQVEAGFLYVAASVAALFHESWSVFEKLLNTRFKWSFQSPGVFYSYGFEHPHFFHSHALGDDQSKHHDLFRTVLSGAQVVEASRIAADEMVSVYAQTDLLMSLRSVKLAEAGEGTGHVADFGRFYPSRVTPLLERMYAEEEYAAGILRAFAESKDEFFAQLNNRLHFIHERSFSEPRYMYNSIREWYPR